LMAVTSPNRLVTWSRVRLAILSRRSFAYIPARYRQRGHCSRSSDHGSNSRQKQNFSAKAALCPGRHWQPARSPPQEVPSPINRRPPPIPHDRTCPPSTDGGMRRPPCIRSTSLYAITREAKWQVQEKCDTDYRGGRLLPTPQRALLAGLPVPERPRCIREGGTRPVSEAYPLLGAAVRQIAARSLP
jgi:hypothetical protein